MSKKKSTSSKNSNIKYSGDAIADMELGIKKRGAMREDAYAAELIPRNEASPDIVGLDEKIERIAKGQNTGIFNNPQELATSLMGFEQWCLKKNIVPSYAAVACYLGCSKGTVLKYMKDTTQYTIYIIHDNTENKDIYSTTRKDYLDMYIDKYSVVESNNTYDNSISNEYSINQNSDNKKNIKSIEKGNTFSLRDKIESGEYSVVVKTLSFADVFTPVMTLVELITTNKAWTMRNPSWPIWLSKNKFGATLQYADRQEIAVQAANPIDDMDDDQILKVAESLPDDE